MRILYITPWFDPEPMIKGIAFVKALSDRGHDIEVITGFPNYPIGRIYPGYKLSMYKREIIDGIIVHRLPLYPSHNNSSFYRSINYISFFLSSMSFALFNGWSFDLIYAYAPVTTWIAAAFAGVMHKKPVIIDIQDLWPDTVLRSGMYGASKMALPLNVMCKFAYQHADSIVSQSRGIRERLIERGVAADKIYVVYNWADESAATAKGNCALDSYNFRNHFNIVYGGNLGKVQGLDTLIHAAHLARNTVQNLQLILIGNGVESDNLERLVQKLHATNVKIAPGVTKDCIGDIFAAADVLAIHLLDDPLFEITIPQKTQFYMAMGKPILVGMRGEAADLITNFGAGIAVAPENYMAMAQAMINIASATSENRLEMGKRAYEAYCRNFSFTSAIAATDDIIRSTLDMWRGLKGKL